MSRYDPNDRGYPGAFAHPAPPPAPVQAVDVKRRSGLGAVALVLALMALLFGWVPVVGLLMIPPALLALALGILGFAVAVVTGRTGRILPFVASILAVFGMALPAASTALFALAVTPWGYTVAMDQVQIELEQDLKRQGVVAERAERLSEEIGDVLRSFAQPDRWREGISFAHRFGRIEDDYRRALWALDESDVAGREVATKQFQEDLARLAERYDADLADEDVRLLVELLGRPQIQQVDNWRQYSRKLEASYTAGHERNIWAPQVCPHSCD